MESRRRRRKMCLWATAGNFWFHPCLRVEFSEVKSLSFIRSSFVHDRLDIRCLFHGVDVSVHL